MFRYQALEIQKDYIPALAHRGGVYKQLNQNDNAKTDFERAIKIKAKDYEDWRAEGTTPFLNYKSMKRHSSV